MSAWPDTTSTRDASSAVALPLQIVGSLGAVALQTPRFGSYSSDA